MRNAVIHYDSTAASAATVSFNDRIKETSLVHAARVLYTIRQMYAHTTFVHIKAHSGAPWNELEDRCAAHHAADIYGLNTPLLHFVDLFGFDSHEVDLALDLFCDKLSTEEFPPMFNGSFVCAAPSFQDGPFSLTGVRELSG